MQIALARLFRERDDATTLNISDPDLYVVPGFWGAGITRNNIGDPPITNPPPSRFWVGLNPIDILIDQNDPLATPY